MRANTGTAWTGGLALSAGLGTTAPAVVGAGLPVIGLGVAGMAYAVDTRRPTTTPPATIALAPGWWRPRYRKTRSRHTSEATGHGPG
ncbi:hypothetical protein [Streptomyces sp. NPDC012510]|uniref:hypothetical protein n=1 Tax=Streptomyces sp. NPDC012510 TaxID=3364838 RepID=UPI0036EA2204